MRKVFARIVLLVCLGVLVLSSSERTMHWLANIRYGDTSLLGSDKYRFGDLYGLTYLAPYRIQTDTSLIRNQAKFQQKRDIELTILGDSYLFSFMKFDTTNFARAKEVTFRWWAEQNLEPLTVQKTTNKKVLLIETVERNVWTVLTKDRLKVHLEHVSPNLSWHESMNALLFDLMYHPYLEQNVDFTLFNVQLFSPLKSLKAYINQRWFNRSTPGVSISKDREFLYIEETMDSTLRSSSFYPIKKDEVHEISERMLAMNQYAKSKGFDEVIFVIIPNPVVITKTEKRPTNELIRKLSLDLGGKVRILDPTDTLMKGGKKYFFKSDSHWNQDGARTWLAQFNQNLLKL